MPASSDSKNNSELTLYLSFIIDNYIFCDNSQKVDKHFSLFFMNISLKLISHLLVIFRENMMHNKIITDYFVRHSTDRLLNVFLFKLLQCKLTDLLVVYN